MIVYNIYKLRVDHSNWLSHNSLVKFFPVNMNSWCFDGMTVISIECPSILSTVNSNLMRKIESLIGSKVSPDARNYFDLVKRAQNERQKSDYNGLMRPFRVIYSPVVMHEHWIRRNNAVQRKEQIERRWWGKKRVQSRRSVWFRKCCNVSPHIFIWCGLCNNNNHSKCRRVIMIEWFEKRHERMREQSEKSKSIILICNEQMVGGQWDFLSRFDCVFRGEMVLI